MVKPLWAILALVLCIFRASAEEDIATITADPPAVIDQTSAVLSCNLTLKDPPPDRTHKLSIRGSYWTHNGKYIDDTYSFGESPYTTVRVDDITPGYYECRFSIYGRWNVIWQTKKIEVKTTPHVQASNVCIENDRAVMVCVGHGYPAIHWAWFRVEADGNRSAIGTNATSSKFEIKSSHDMTRLTVHNLDVEKDEGDYVCSGTNEIAVASAHIHLQVHSRPWTGRLCPLLVIAAAVSVVTIILVTVRCQRRRRLARVQEPKTWKLLNVNV